MSMSFIPSVRSGDPDDNDDVCDCDKNDCCDDGDRNECGDDADTNCFDVVNTDCCDGKGDCIS